MDVYELGQYMRIFCTREIRQINALALGWVDLLKIPWHYLHQHPARVNSLVTRQAFIDLYIIHTLLESATQSEKA